MLVFNKVKCVFAPVCKVGTNSFFNYWGGVIYGEKDHMVESISSGEEAGENTRIIRQNLRHRIANQFNIIWNSADFMQNNKQPFQKAIYADYYKFAYVRNPWARLVSAFREVIRRYPFGQAKADEAAGLTYYEIHDLMDGYVDFENFVNFVVNIEKDHTNVINGHWRKQSVVLCIHRGMKWDFIGKLENIDKDFRVPQKRLGLEKTKLTREHCSAKYNYKKYYKNKKLIDMVGEHFREDVETFGYEYEDDKS